MNDQQFAELLALGHEQPGIEFKGPGFRSDKHFLAKVIRAVLAMANRRDGGFVVIGVEEAQSGLNRVGLSADQLKTWNHDDVAASLAEYAEPSVSFQLEVHVHEGSKYVLLIVEEFPEIPILCAKDFQDGHESILRRGACYVRSKRKPETAEIPSQEDMRDLIELATEKRLRRWVAQARAAGILGPPLSTTAQASDEQLFREQAKDLL